MFDVNGMVVTARTDISDQMKVFAQNTNAVSITEALKNADVFLGRVWFSLRLQKLKAEKCK